MNAGNVVCTRNGIFSHKMKEIFLWVAAKVERTLRRPLACWESARGWGAACPPPSANTAPLPHGIFAPNHVVAKCSFWYFVSQLKKMKESSGEIVLWWQAFEKHPLQVKNFGFWLWLPQRHPPHTLGELGPDRCWHRLPVLWRHGAPALCRTHWIQRMKVEEIMAACRQRQSGSSKTPRSSSRCPTRSFVTSTSHASPPRGPTPSFRCRASLSPSPSK